jgi:hypothetical protein
MEQPETFVMKNSIKTAVVYSSVLFLLVSCHSGYEEKNGKIYHQWIHGGSWTKKESLVKEADASSFEVIENDIHLDLARDKNHVFTGASILEYADPLTFGQIKEYYWKDKHHVFLLQFGGTDCRIQNADPKTFLVIEDYLWAKDSKSVFHGFDELDSVSPKTFTVIDEHWGRDDSFYYYHNSKIDSLDYETAEIVSRDYIKDKNSLFFQNRLVKDANPKTFKADGVGSFGHDDRYMFRGEVNEGPITEEYKRLYIDDK